MTDLGTGQKNVKNDGFMDRFNKKEKCPQTSQK